MLHPLRTLCSFSFIAGLCLSGVAGQDGFEYGAMGSAPCKAPFKLNEQFIRDMFAQSNAGNVASFLGYIDPNVIWTVGRTRKLNLATWQTEIGAKLYPRLKNQSLEIILTNVDVIGNKVLIEARGIGEQINGERYDNSYFWVHHWDLERKKIVQMDEYLDTVLAEEVFAIPLPES